MKIIRTLSRISLLKQDDSKEDLAVFYQEQAMVPKVLYLEKNIKLYFLIEQK